jgi:DNA-binding NtrC family response regulator
MDKGKILVADDEASLRMLLTNELKRAGYSVEAVENGEVALERMREDFFHVVLLDLLMPKMGGVELLREIKKENIQSEVIILTGNASVETALECMRMGAYEYLKKPYNISELCIQIQRAMERFRSQHELKNLQEELKRSGRGGKILGKSRVIEELHKIIERVAPSNSTVLILGESGTGKELVARSIHGQSLRSGLPFIAVNCASFSEALLESELFGHERGAFTDAKTQKLGLAEIAHSGTLFLDEIGEIPIHFQAKLLRFLETGEIRRVGGTRDIKLNVRVICATNQPLEALVQKKLFRADLFYRLNVLSVTVPTLKARLDDIPILVQFFIRAMGFHNQFDSGAIDVLKSYEWRGNVRELRNVVERTCILAPGKVVTAADLSMLTANSHDQPLPEPGDGSAGQAGGSLSMSEMERLHILRVLKIVRGHKSKAAKLLEINAKTLYLKMKSYNIFPIYE